MNTDNLLSIMAREMRIRNTKNQESVFNLVYNIYIDGIIFRFFLFFSLSAIVSFAYRHVSIVVVRACLCICVVLRFFDPISVCSRLVLISISFPLFA